MNHTHQEPAAPQPQQTLPIPQQPQQTQHPQSGQPKQPPQPPQQQQNLQQRRQPQGRVRNVPSMTLFEGASREGYLQTGVPLYEASIKCNWKAAEAILVKRPELVRYSITENGETPLHVAASAKGDPKCVEEFVKKLVEMMKEEDLELQNKNYNTALYLAAVAGNVETIKIMVNKNRSLLTISGGTLGEMMPLYAAASFGNKHVVKYIYEELKNLSDKDGWNLENRSTLLEKCVGCNMFDIALDIVKNYEEVDTSGALRVLAGKPEAFNEGKSNIMGMTINILKSVFASIGLKVGGLEKETNALLFLRHIWNDIVKMPAENIDAILKGPRDSNWQGSKTVSGWAVKVVQLRKFIIKHVENMNLETNNIVNGSDSKSKALQLQDLISNSIVTMQDETEKIIKGPSNSIMQDSMLDSNKKHLALELQKLIFKHIAHMHDTTLKIIKSTQVEDQTVKLRTFIFDHINQIKRETQLKVNMYEKETYSSRVMFIAAEMGNTKFLIELIRGYPDIIWKVNDNNQSMFHIAVKHRHEDIYNLLYEIGAMKGLITPLKDHNENNMWHLAGKRATDERLANVSGVALQMQLELLWFHEVKKMIPPLYRDTKNGDGLTAQELFTKEHKNLLTLSEKWMKETSSQCMVVATLITTIVFAATFVVPGGYSQTDGIPFFHSKATFVVFIVANAISLISSTTSILMFLSILTSRYAQYDFLKSLPRKLLWGLVTLFLSITSMMVAFGVSFFILYHDGLLWMPILICVLVVFPTLLYIWLQYGLFFDVIYSIRRSRYMFKPQKHVIYYENPKV